MNIVDVLVNQLGESIVEGTIVDICKKNGDNVTEDEVIASIETDKITIEIVANASGIIQNMSCQEGDVVAIGQKIAEIHAGDAKNITNQQSQPKEEQQSPTTSVDSKAFGVKNSPAAEKLMAENNLTNVKGTGIAARITKEDVIKHQQSTSTPIKIEKNIEKNKQSSAKSTVNQTPPQNITTPNKSSERQERIVKMSPLRKKIAQRLKESQNTAAILTTFNEINMQAVMQLRKKYKEIFEKKHGIKLGFMSFFIKAATCALQEIPEVNAEIRDNSIVYKDYCDVGVAVGSDKGLVVPILRNAENMELFTIEKQIINFGKKAKEGTLSISDMTGGTFTISNGGVYGSLMSTPIINPPQSAILGMHSIVERPIVGSDKQITIAPMMYVALSYDHRIIDGKEAVTFLVKIKNYIEDPMRLLMSI